jgi:hypothetical protein
LGSGTINAQGAVVTGTPSATLAGGGGGAGGTVIVQTAISGGTTFSGININANGASALSAAVNAGGAGGGGGGRILLSQTASAPVVTGITSDGGTGGNTNGTDGATGGSTTLITGIDPVATSPGVKPAYICAQSSTVPVTISHVHTRSEGNELVVDFSVASEAGTQGYRVLADLDDKLRVEVGSVNSRAIDSLKEINYSVRTRAIGASAIWIEELSVQGKSTAYGPYPIGRAIGERGLATSLNWSAVAAEQASFRAAQRTLRRGAGSNVAELSVSTSAWVELSAAELASFGISGKDVLISQGSRSVPTRVKLDAANQLQSIGFYAQAISDSIYTKTAVYRIEAGNGLALTLEGNSASGGVSSVSSERRFDDNVLYTFAAPGEDPWFMARSLRNTPANVAFALNDFAADSTASVRIDYFGGLNYDGTDPDHHVQFAINGQVIGSDIFDGLSARSRTFNVPVGALRAGNNTLDAVLINDTGYAFDIVNIEGFTLKYVRTAQAVNNRLDMIVNALPSDTLFGNGFEDGAVRSADTSRSTVRISGISADAVVLRERNGVISHIADTNGALSVNANVGDRLIVSPVTRPSLMAAAVINGDPMSGNASYVIISHPSFISGLSSFVAAKQAQGFSTRVVDVEAIYRYYNAGVVDPNAISAAIRTAKNNGATHVLLVGGDTYDYFNVLGVNSVSFIPTHYRRTDSLISFAPADSVYADTDGNGAPDLLLGRWPVRTQAELSAVVAKTIAYQNLNRAVAVNDRSLNGESYNAARAPIASLLGTQWTTAEVDLDQYPSGQAPAARTEIVNRLQGASLLTYFGHSAPSAWSREGLITANQVYGGLFTPVNNSFAAVQYGCWATYFVEPTSSTVAHGLLLQAKGAALVMGATALTGSESDVVFINALTPRLGNQSFGEAFKQSVIELNDRGVHRDIVIGGTVLGDPSLR